MLTDSEVLSRLRDSGMWRDLEAQEEARLQADRAGAAAELERSTSHVSKRRPWLVAKRAAAFVKTTTARAALNAAIEAELAVQHDIGDLDAVHRGVTMRAHGVLRSTTPDEWRALIGWLHEEQQRRDGSWVELAPQSSMTVMRPKTRGVRTNVPAVAQRLSLVHAALKEANALLEMPLTRAEIREACARIRAGIPDVASTVLEDIRNAS